MAKPRDSYPETATNAARKAADDGEGSSDGARDGEAALREALAAHGDELAAVVDSTDELQDVLRTAILVAAAADEEDVDHLTASTANLVRAADGLSTEEAAALATEVGENADDLSDALDTVLALQREGHLDDLVTIATAFSGSLSSSEVAELAEMLEENDTDIVEALDLLLDLQREDHLADLVELARTLSSLEVDEETVDGLNSLLAAVGEAERESEPVGVLGLFRRLRTPDVRAGLGYLVAIVRAQGRRLREP